MSAYNCERTIELAIRSIQKQTFQSWELIVIDDGSTDRTAEVVRRISDPRIRLFVDGKNRRLPARLNQAVGLARGKYFARMDGDDISFPHRLDIQLKFLSGRPDIDLLGGQYILFRGEGKLVGVPRTVSDHKSVCGTWWSEFNLLHPTWIGSLEWFKQNPYSENAILSEDRELLLRTHRHSRFAAVPEYIYGYREEGISLVKTFPARMTYLRERWRDRLLHREYAAAVGGAAADLAKIGVDAIAIWTRLNYFILRHRASPASREVRRIWEEVWPAVAGG